MNSTMMIEFSIIGTALEKLKLIFQNIDSGIGMILGVILKNIICCANKYKISIKFMLLMY